MSGGRAQVNLSAAGMRIDYGGGGARFVQFVHLNDGEIDAERATALATMFTNAAQYLRDELRAGTK